MLWVCVPAGGVRLWWTSASVPGTGIRGRVALFSLIVVAKWINLYRQGGAACAARLSLMMPTGWTGFQAGGLFGGCTRVSSFA